MRSRMGVLAAPLRRPRLRRLVGAFLVNELGDGIAVVVLPLLVHEATGSGLLTGTTFAGLRALGLAGRPIGGLIADRLDRVRILRTTFVVRASLLGLGLVGGSDGALIVCLLLTAFVGTIDDPAGEAAIREDAADQAQQVATIRKVSRALSGVVGLAIGGLVVGAVGAEVAVVIDIGTYLVALVLLPPAGPGPEAEPRSDSAPPTGWTGAAWRAVTVSLADAREGLEHLRGHADLRVVTGTAMLSTAVVTGLLTAAVVWLDGLHDTPDGAYGVALAGYSAGAIVGLVAAGTIAWRISVRRLASRTLAVAGAACAFGVTGSDWRVLSATWLVWGVTWGPLDVWGDTRMVALTPLRLLGRAYGGVGMLAALGQVVGGVTVGLLIDATDPRAVIVGLGGILLVASAWLARPASGRAPRVPATGDHDGGGTQWGSTTTRSPGR